MKLFGATGQVSGSRGLLQRHRPGEGGNIVGIGGAAKEWRQRSWKMTGGCG